jgi:hypothetical protein
MDFVPREEFEAVKAMAAKAREQNEKLEARIAALEARVNESKSPQHPQAESTAALRTRRFRICGLRNRPEARRGDSCAATKSCASLNRRCFVLRRPRSFRSRHDRHLHDEVTAAPHPIDMLERTVEDNGWPFERGQGRLNLSVAGKWCDHHFSFPGARTCNRCTCRAPSRCGWTTSASRCRQPADGT